MSEVASLSDLFDDGDYVELDDGRTVRLKIEPDDMPFLFRDRHGNLFCNDEMWGEFAFVDTRSDYRHNSRPAGFTGNAEIIQSRGGDPLWWEPPSGDYQPYDPETGKPARRGSKAFDEVRSYVLELLEWGYTAVVIEVLEPCDHGHRHVVNTASLGGIEPDPDAAYRREVISELLAEVGFETVEEANA